MREEREARKVRMERLLEVVENASGDVKLADEAERRAIEELRVMGQQVTQEWGKRLAVAAGFNKRSWMHGLGDGAPWISDQMELQFGTQCRYHVDFYHVSAITLMLPSCVRAMTQTG